MDPVVASVRSLKLRPRHHGGCAWRYAAGWTTLAMEAPSGLMILKLQFKGQT